MIIFSLRLISLVELAMCLLMQMAIDLATVVRKSYKSHQLCFNGLAFCNTFSIASIFNFNPVSDPPGAVNDVSFFL